MIASQARVETDRAARYLAQLCKHFAHKVPAEWSADRGTARFEWGTCTMVAQPDVLLLRAEAADADGLGRVEHVVGDHAERFGARDQLRVTWTRHPDPTPPPSTRG